MVVVGGDGKRMNFFWMMWFDLWWSFIVIIIFWGEDGGWRERRMFLWDEWRLKMGVGRDLFFVVLVVRMWERGVRVRIEVERWVRIDRGVGV